MKRFFISILAIFFLVSCGWNGLFQKKNAYEFLLTPEPAAWKTFQKENKTSGKGELPIILDQARYVLSRRLEMYREKIDSSEISEKGLRLTVRTASDPEFIRTVLSMQGALEFRLANDRLMAHLDSGNMKMTYGYFHTANGKEPKAKLPAGSKWFQVMGKAKDNGEVEMGWIVLGKPLGLSETDILRAFAKKGRDGTPVIRFELKKESAEKFAELTGNHIGSRLAILVDGLVYSAPVIRAAIQGGKVEITGDFIGQQAEMIAQTLLLGRVPVELRAVLEKSPD